ncbi:MAG: BlaI/MecI/CopY family transcriptional regulator [Firmicutes bacterium]|nr:BlaI/MecI/CopY family transcriptional regulator [Bacillota bacterium]
MKKLNTTQEEIMITIWSHGQPVKRAKLQELLTGKEWKTPSLNTVLARLVDLGYLRIEHDRKDYVYHTVISKEDYLKEESALTMARLFDGSVYSVLSAFCPKEKATKEDIKQIEEYLKTLKK